MPVLRVYYYRIQCDDPNKTGCKAQSPDSESVEAAARFVLSHGWKCDDAQHFSGWTCINCVPQPSRTAKN